MINTIAAPVVEIGAVVITYNFDNGILIGYELTWPLTVNHKDMLAVQIEISSFMSHNQVRKLKAVKANGSLVTQEWIVEYA